MLNNSVKYNLIFFLNLTISCSDLIPSGRELNSMVALLYVEFSAHFVLHINT